MAAELIALESNNQTAFTKAVKNIKKSIAAKKQQKDELSKKNKGIILVEHLPYGFFEEGLQSFFSQFGRVLRVRLARSKKTGRSKGYAFVEFEFEEVAKIAAEAMNNYLMFERLVKCKLLPTGTNGKKLFTGRHITEDSYPRLKRRNELKRSLAGPLTEEAEAKHSASRLKKIVDHNKKLAELGINYQFTRFTRTKPSATPEKNVEEDTKVAVVSKASPKSEKQQSPKYSPQNAEKVTKVEVQSRVTPKAEKRRVSKHSPASVEKVAKVEAVSKVTPKAEKRQLPKFSPKLLRSRAQRQSEVLSKPVAPEPMEVEEPKLRRMSTKVSPKAEKVIVKAEKAMPKFSPKLLRSRAQRQSEGSVKSTPASTATRGKQGRKSIK